MTATFNVKKNIVDNEKRTPTLYSAVDFPVLSCRFSLLDSLSPQRTKKRGLLTAVHSTTES